MIPQQAVTDLWVIPSRTAPPLPSELHSAGSSDFQGNFVPHIPYYLMLRHTQPDDIVLDMFEGSGTTKVVAHFMNRKYVGVDLHNGIDSAQPGLHLPLCAQSAALTILHPPYLNIVPFSLNPKDLSLMQLPQFTQAMQHVFANALAYTKPQGHIALVIGDIYQNKRVVPLSHLMHNLACTLPNLVLRAIIIKNIANNEKGKGLMAGLWRYRALKNGFYIFQHEYIYVYQVGTTWC